MSDLRLLFEPLDEVRIIPVHWELNQSDHTKLSLGNDVSRNHWHWFIENNTAHIYKGFRGTEHFRFTLHPLGGGKYVIESIDTHDATHIYEQAKLIGWSKQETEERLSIYNRSAIEEVAGMLADFFGIKVGA